MSEYKTIKAPRHLDVYSRKLKEISSSSETSINSKSYQKPMMSKKSKTIAYNKFSNLIAASKSRKKCLQLQEMFEQLALEAKLRMDQILFDRKVLCTEY